MAKKTKDVKTTIKERRKELGLTLKDIAEKVGVSEATVSRWESGNIENMKRNRIAKLAEALHISPAVIMGWDENPAPIYSAAAGEGLICDVPVDEINMSLDDDETLAYVVGRSMEPTLMDGDIVVVKVQPVPDNKRQICLVKVNGEENTFKRVDVKENGITLIADNLDVYAPHFYTAEEVEDLPVRIMGVVTRLIRKVK